MGEGANDKEIYIPVYKHLADTDEKVIFLNYTINSM
ncbi:hypothetical protein IM45_203 [Candidatus Palibaumannia cicadellinicola]|uniref:Uncharacterized protein n=1 Tax=Candidatus Palibaumannia cicadellinicola TaxID=186490 RepID=A0A088MXG5_9GAMM|nr:hypothetical protein IM45_203 [Candidatus Baumannia cicadellinicola]